MKTQEEIQYLKQNWLNDPCWDIEETEGFEEYREQLLEYRLRCEHKWEEGYKNRIAKRAAELNCSIELIVYIERLEYRLDDMERKLDALYFNQ